MWSHSSGVKAVRAYVPAGYIEKGDINLDFARATILEEAIGMKTGWLGYMCTKSFYPFYRK